MIDGSATGTVSWFFWAANTTFSAVANTDTNSGSFTITLTMDTPEVNTIGTSTSTNPTGLNNQKKTFYANGRFWVWFSDGTNMTYTSSMENLLWTEYDVRACTNGTQFSVAFDGTYVHYALGNNTGLYYRRGTPNAGGTTTLSTEQTVSTGATSLPSIAVSSGGYPFITYIRSGTPYVVSSGKTDGTWATSATTQLSSTSSSFWFVSILRLVSTKMYITYGYNNTLYGRQYSAGSWGSQETITVAVEPKNATSMVAFGDEVYLAYIRNTTNEIYLLKRISSVWSQVESVATGESDSFPALSIDFPSNTLYTFWPQGDCIYYRTYNLLTDTAGSITQWQDETTFDYLNNTLTVSLRDYGDKVGVVYTQDNGPNYDIQFAYIDFSAYASFLTLYGGYYEDDGDYADTLSVDIYDGTTFEGSTRVAETQIFKYNGTITTPVVKWLIGTTLMRTYTLPAGTSSVTLYVPESTYTSYTIRVQDFTSQVTAGTTVLNTILTIGGSEQTIERVIIPSSYNVPLVLVVGRTYTREVILSGGTVVRDTYSPSSTTFTDTMNIYLTGFSATVQLAYKYLLIDAMRPTLTSMNVSYLDTLDQTTSLNITWYYQNRSLAWSVATTSIPAGAYTYTWNAADNETDYRVRVTAVHTSFGTMIKDIYLPALSTTYTNPFDLSFLSTEPWINDIIPYAIILASAGVFSTITVGVGMFVTVAVAAIFMLPPPTGLGWIEIDMNLLILAIALVIIFTLSRRKETGMP